MSGPSAFGGIAGNVKKIALFIALWACVRRLRSRDEESAFRTFPVSLVAFRADISLELSISSIAAERTCIIFFFTSHYINLLLQYSFKGYKTCNMTVTSYAQICHAIYNRISFKTGLTCWAFRKFPGNIYLYPITSTYFSNPVMSIFHHCPQFTKTRFYSCFLSTSCRN